MTPDEDQVEIRRAYGRTAIAKARTMYMHTIYNEPAFVSEGVLYRTDVFRMSYLVPTLAQILKEQRESQKRLAEEGLSLDYGADSYDYTRVIFDS